MREELAARAEAITGLPFAPSQFVCAKEGAPVSSAAPLQFGVDETELAAALHAALARFTLYGVPLLREVTHNQGHLLFYFTDAFYTALLKQALLHYPAAPPLNAGENLEETVRRLHYAQRRMWMLARTASGEVHCPPEPSVQRALFLTTGIPERMHHPRARTIRLNDAADALLNMFHFTPPYARHALMRESAHVGEAAARILHACILVGDTSTTTQ